MRNAKVLVVEDSLTQAEALRVLLEREGARVHVVNSAEAALEHLQRSPGALPDLVLSDVVMPGVSGYELTRRMKNDPDWGRVPVVLLTSLTDPLDIVRGLECGADNYVTKPYDPEYLVARLRHVLGQQRLSRGLRASLGINVQFLGRQFTITSEREQILDLFLSSVEDVVRTNAALEQSQMELAEAQRQLESYARQMAQRAHSSGEQLRAIIEASPLAIVALDRSGRVTLWNPSAERILGYTAEEALRSPPRTIPDDRRGEFDQALADAESGQSVRLETQRITKDRRLIEVFIAVSAIRDPGGTVAGFVAAIEDITERKQTAEALARSQAQLVQAQKLEAIGALAGGIAHDFNNLLTVIRSYSAMLVEDLQPGDEENRQYASEILGAADRASALTRQLLSFSRKQVVQPQLFHVDQVIQGVERFLGRLLPSNIELAFQLGSGEEVVKMDPSQLEQVVMNLVINAAHATPRGGQIDVSTRAVTLHEPRHTATGDLPSGRYVTLTVRDTGTGMDEQTRAKIFEPFFTTKAAGTGTGLGLSIVRGIVAEQKGGVDVESAPGRGTTFEIYLPVVHESVTEAPPVPAEVPTGNEVILVVEDDEAVRDAVRLALERYGYTVLDAHDGAQALIVAEMFNVPPDLLITDLMMPRVTGRELVEQLERDGRMPRVLLMSGYADDDTIRRELKNAKYPFIQKPFTREALARKVREVLDS